MTSDKTVESLLEDLITSVQEQLQWQKVAVLPAVKAEIDRSLVTDEMKNVYQACDGKRSLRDISKATGVATSTVARWTKNWRESGIIFENSNSRLCKLIGLE